MRKDPDHRGPGERSPPEGGLAGWAWLAVVPVLLFLWPAAFLPERTPLTGAAGLALHVGVFAGWAQVSIRVWGRRISPSWIWLMLAGLAGALEWVQPWIGRSGEWLDWVAGAAGAGWICMFAPAGARRMRWGGVGVMMLVPIAWAGGLLGLETRAFPVLAQPGLVWAAQGWVLNGATLSTTEEGEFRLRRSPPAEVDHDRHPGVFRRPAVADWRGAEFLTTRIYWPETESAVWALRVDDRSGNPPYADRFQREFAVTQGWNIVRIPVEKLGRTSGGRPLDLGNIHIWGVFLVSDTPFDYVLLDVVQLELPQEPP